MCHIEHMRRITIRELHMHTGKWVREAKGSQSIVVTDRGVPVATLREYSEADCGTPFSERRPTEAFEKLPRIDLESSRGISEDRDRS